MRSFPKKSLLCNKLTVVLISVLVSLFTNVSAQQKITGEIKSQDNLPLEGATITNTTLNIQTISNADGSFSITAMKGNVIVFSFVEYTSQQLTVGDKLVINMTLAESISSLEEVVMLGYSRQKVKEITGSVAIVKPKDLTAVPAGQVEQMLQGRVAGLNVITSGMPGGKSNVRIHGIGNFGDVTPLYIIDGVQGNINNLNPYDIESLQVLKDAGAYAIYGVRGANGVIIITTKKGQSGKTRISYDFYIGDQKPLKKGLDLLNPQQNADLAWLADRNSGQVGSNGNPDDPYYGNGATPVLPDYLVAGPYTGLFEGDPRVNPDLYNIDFTVGNIYQIIPANKSGTDWFHELFKPAYSQNHTITGSGGNDKNKYLFSLGYLDQQGTLLYTYLKRFTARINTTFAMNDKISFGENLQLSYRDNPQIATQQGPNGNEIDG